MEYLAPIKAQKQNGGKITHAQEKKHDHVANDDVPHEVRDPKTGMLQGKALHGAVQLSQEKSLLIVEIGNTCIIPSLAQKVTYIFRILGNPG